MMINARSLPRPNAHDRYRPVYHFTPPSGWLNDPNGIVHHEGRWHVYYQHNPTQPTWGDIHWGHASSADLLTWRDEPLALAPSPTTADGQGCFSGSFAWVNGTPTLYYTGWQNGVQTQCRATSQDLMTWEKDANNPIIPHPPEHVRQDDFRDPYVFQHGKRWYMVIGASLHHDRGAALLYRSDNGQQWTYLHVLHTATRTDQGVMWECPNFFPLGDRWVLVVSVWPKLGARYFLGSFEDERFTAEREGVIDGDGGAFAHLTAVGPDGRLLQWAWIDEQRHRDLIVPGGWAGVLSVPRQLALVDGDLYVQPVSELTQLRDKLLCGGEVLIGPTEPTGFQGTHLDLQLTLEADIEHPVHLSLLCSPDRSEETILTFDPGARLLKLDRSRSSLDPRVNRDSQRVHLALRRGERLELRVLLDGSVLEVYAGGRACLTSRLYPSRTDSVLGRLTAERVTAGTFTVWTMGEDKGPPR
ncbi:beta-fructofuranosidase [Deinococcus hopiensis KR-140]|uniref:beta-fructofuranosidase n=2 Tax=Deinococcus TaxID=1298 RepID=A0A1W1UVN1_9DEIO|nr:beta-fructofuranosidase [Deinococcus hopiensis KR-140]